MKILFLLYTLIFKFAVLNQKEYSSKGMIPSYDKIPVEIVEMPDVLSKQYDKLLIPYLINPKSATTNQ